MVFFENLLNNTKHVNIQIINERKYINCTNLKSDDQHVYD